MTSVVHEFRVTAFGTTREECISALDGIALTVLDSLGGAPWIMPDDDIKKVEAQAISPVLADNDGYCYVGIRSYSFRGPIVIVASATYHDGFKVQHAES